MLTTLERVKQGLDSLVNGPSTGLDSLVNGSSTNAGTSTDATPLSALAEDEGLDTPELTQAAIRFAEAEQASAQTHLQSVVEALSPLEASLLELQAVTARIDRDALAELGANGATVTRSDWSHAFGVQLSHRHAWPMECKDAGRRLEERVDSCGGQTHGTVWEQRPREHGRSPTGRLAYC